MSNPFRDWTPERAAAHNARVAGKTRSTPEPQTPAQVPRQISPAVSLLSAPPKSPEQKLNQTEREFLAILRTRHPGAQIHIEDITLRLAHDCRYTPDFVLWDGCLIAYEVKGGFIREDAAVKLKVAARAYMEIKFILAQKKNGWTEKHVTP